MNPGHIIKGWLKALGFITVSNAEAKLSILRMQICGRCEWAKESSVLEVVNNDVQYENRLVCGKCHCPCLQKSLVVDEKCPINEW